MTDRGAFKVVDEFEKRLCEYTGAPHAVAVDSCTNALFLAFMSRRMSDELFHILGGPEIKTSVTLPKRTYVGVAQAARNAGFKVEWKDIRWTGQYLIDPIGVIDAARRFTTGMYIPGSLQCLSFQASKILPIGRGGAILCDDAGEAEWLRLARFDGRNQNISIFSQQRFPQGWHMYMTPQEAARGLWLMMYAKDHNDDLPGEYPDLSLASIQ